MWTAKCKNDQYLIISFYYNTLILNSIKGNNIIHIYIYIYILFFPPHNNYIMYVLFQKKKKKKKDDQNENYYNIINCSDLCNLSTDCRTIYAGSILDENYLVQIIENKIIFVYCNDKSEKLNKYETGMFNIIFKFYF